MESIPSGNVTRLLVDWQAGDDRALEQLMPLVYGELRRLRWDCGSFHISSAVIIPPARWDLPLLASLPVRVGRAAAPRGVESLGSIEHSFFDLDGMREPPWKEVSPGMKIRTSVKGGGVLIGD